METLGEGSAHGIWQNNVRYTMSSSQGDFDGGKFLIMHTNMHRLSNTTYSEVALCLSLPNLSIYLEANNQDISLFEDVDIGAGNKSIVLL